MISSRNSTTHGLTARTVVLPHEDPDAIAARTREWEAHFRPASPDARFLLNECVLATLLADRFHYAHDTAVARQLDGLIEGWRGERRKRVNTLRKGLVADPVGTFAGLIAFSQGCRWLIERLEQFGVALAALGYWTPSEADEVVRLLGARPEPDQLHRDEEAYFVVLFNLMCQPSPPADAIEALLEPGRRPERWRTSDPAEMLRALEAGRVLLGKSIADMVEWLRAIEQQLVSDVDGPELARLLNPASILRDPDEARLFHRYRSEYRSTFHRAHKELLATLKRDAATADGEGVSGPAADTAISRNEPGLVTQSRAAEDVVSSAVAPEAGSRDEPLPEAAAAVEPIAGDSRNEPDAMTQSTAAKHVASPMMANATRTDAIPAGGRGVVEERSAPRNHERPTPLEVLAARYGDKLLRPVPGGKTGGPDSRGQSCRDVDHLASPGELPPPRPGSPHYPCDKVDPTRLTGSHVTNEATFE